MFGNIHSLQLTIVFIELNLTYLVCGLISPMKTSLPKNEDVNRSCPRMSILIRLDAGHTICNQNYEFDKDESVNERELLLKLSNHIYKFLN